MPLSPATRLGQYEILSPLGAGGMGEVYRARDTKLAREVAIKILPAEVAADREWLARFEREARSASALNHPNIVTIYEIGHADSVSYISMELVQGRSLRELVSEGPLSEQRLLALSTQIAQGVARAHEGGIVHRDLKPENLMVTRDGLVKILDFGLAKRTGGHASDTKIGASTGPGVVMGSAGYMSPEQAIGAPVDFHCDQFSLGAILYEMASGRRAFARSSEAETMAAIIREEPESLSRVAPRTPAAFRWVVERCLAKEPEDRYGSSRDLARDLAQVRDHGKDVAHEPAAASGRLGPRWMGWAAIAGLVIVAAWALFLGLRRTNAPLASALRFSVPMPAGALGPRLTMSPDGTRLGIEGFAGGRRRIYIHSLESNKTIELEGSIGAAGHFWSPDSRFLAFYSEGRLWKLPITGGPPISLCDAMVVGPGAWSPNGTIVFPQRAEPRGIFRVPDAGGRPVRITAVGPSEENHLVPCFLPDGRRFLYVSNSFPGAPSSRELRIASIESRQSQSVMRLDSKAEFTAGQLVFVREGSLFAQPFDERSGRTRGDPVLLADEVSYFMNTADAGFSLSKTGALTYLSGAVEHRMVWRGRDGKEIGSLGEPSAVSGARSRRARVRGLRISPDGERVAVALRDKRTGTSDIWLFERSRSAPTRLNSDPVDETSPVWSPDGGKIIYRSDRNGPPDIYEMDIRGAPGGERPLLKQEWVQEPEDVSRDGRFLAFMDTQQWPNWDIRLLTLHGARATKPWLVTRFTEESPRFSPDGRWIAYASDESGEPEIYVALANGGGAKKRLSLSGGEAPRWRADGRELYYLGPGDLIMAVSVSTGGDFTVGVPVPLFRVEGIEDYDVSADGSRFLVSEPAEKTPESRVRVIVNWPSLLTSDRSAAIPALGQ
jgi:Tol biopolymer transport system component